MSTLTHGHRTTSVTPQATSLLTDDAVTVLPTGEAVGGSRDDAAAHLTRWGDRPASLPAATLHAWVREVGLTGRGGAHFPSAVKWDSALASGPGGVVVVNAAEGEPAAGKDTALLQLRPHLVLDGAMHVAEVIGAREVVLWVHHGAAALAGARRALAERRAADLDDRPVRVLAAPPTYVSGEASAVINAVLTGSARPTTVTDPARPWGTGAPVLVHNAETLARVAALARTGPESVVAGSLVTVSTTGAPGEVRERRVVELRPHETLSDAVLRSGVPWPAAALLGGYGGSWHRWADIAALTADPAALRARGLSLGAGVLLLVDDAADVMAEATSIAGWMARESAGQCGPCVFGLPSLAESMRRGRRAEVRATLPLLEGRGACRHPDGVVRMVRTALDLSTESPR